MVLGMCDSSINFRATSYVLNTKCHGWKRYFSSSKYPYKNKVLLYFLIKPQWFLCCVKIKVAWQNLLYNTFSFFIYEMRGGQVFLFFFLGGMGMIIRELTVVFVLLLYGNLYIFLCSILCLYNVDIWDETLLQVMEIIHS